MILRWGKRSAGGIVKAGCGGWTLILGVAHAPILGYTDPVTGDGASRVGWNLRASRRYIDAKRRLNEARPSNAAASRQDARAPSSWEERLAREAEDDLAMRERLRGGPDEFGRFLLGGPPSADAQRRAETEPLAALLKRLREEREKR